MLLPQTLLSILGICVGLKWETCLCISEFKNILMGIEKAGISIVFCFRGCSLFDALACFQPSFPRSPKHCSLDFESLFLIQVILSDVPTWHIWIPLYISNPLWVSFVVLCWILPMPLLCILWTGHSYEVCRRICWIFLNLWIWCTLGKDFVC